MTDPTVGKPYSSSVGDYIKAIWDLGGVGSASTKDVADRLLVSPASVSNMFVRLQEMGLVEYERYQGASLTERGRVEALRLVRRHRLIETFLLEHLGYDWQEVHEEAERLEHAVSDGFTDRLAQLLGHPDHDPHGDPIPSAEGTLEADDSFPSEPGCRGSSGSASSRSGTRTPRCSITSGIATSSRAAAAVREVRALDGVVIVEDEEGEVYALGEALARSIFVRDESVSQTRNRSGKERLG